MTALTERRKGAYLRGNVIGRCGKEIDINMFEIMDHWRERER
jgi:hypothetical protein